MDGGHESLNNSKVIMDDLSQRSQAVSGAGGIGHNLHAGLVSILVDSHDKHGGIRGGCRDNNLLGASLKKKK